MRAPESPAGSSPAGAAARAHWEVLAAVGILVGVLLVIDGASIRQPVLLLSFGPLAFLTFAAVFPLTAEAVAAWIAGFVGLALTSQDARYAGLAYPAIALVIPLLIHRLRRSGVRR
jgi:hypothetical protein